MLKGKFALYVASCRLLWGFLFKQQIHACQELMINKLYIDAYYPDPEVDCNTLIVCYHGLNHHGRKDPRLQLLAGQFQKLGFTVLVPELDALRNFSLCDDGFLAIERATRIIQASDIAKTCKRRGIVTVCYAASGVLYTLGRDDLRDFAQAVFVIGGCFSPLKRLDLLGHNKPLDEYGRAIAIKNFCHDYDPDDAKIVAGLQCIIEDTLMQNNFALTENFLQTEILTTVQKDIITGWLQRIKNEKKIFDHDFTAEEYSSLREFFIQHLEALQQFKIPCALIHGIDDEIFPAEETVDFHQILEKNNIANYIVLTKLFSHADLAPAWSTFHDLLRIIKAIVFFLTLLHIRRSNETIYS